jgi:hypothetical protein
MATVVAILYNGEHGVVQRGQSRLTLISFRHSEFTLACLFHFDTIGRTEPPIPSSALLLLLSQRPIIQQVRMARAESK